MQKEIFLAAFGIMAKATIFMKLILSFVILISIGCSNNATHSDFNSISGIWKCVGFTHMDGSYENNKIKGLCRISIESDGVCKFNFNQSVLDQYDPEFAEVLKEWMPYHLLNHGRVTIDDGEFVLHMQADLEYNEALIVEMKEYGELHMYFGDPGFLFIREDQPGDRNPRGITSR